MRWWLLVCSLLLVGGLLLQLGAPLTSVVVGGTVGATMVWWRHRASATRR